MIVYLISLDSGYIASIFLISLDRPVQELLISIWSSDWMIQKKYIKILL